MDSSEFDALEQQIQHLVRKFSADSILLKVRAAVDESETPGTIAHEHFEALPYGLPPFVAATICDFVMCHGSPSGEAASWPAFRDIALACHDYPLEDPISHDKEVNEAFRKAPLTPFISRVLAKQWEYHTNPYGWMARCKLLWQEAIGHAIAAGDSSFDFHEKFELLFGVSLDDYLTVAIHAQDFARHHKRGFTRQVFNNRRAEGYGIPNDAVVKAVLAKFSADSNAYQGEFEQWTPNDRRFRMYTPSPLVTYPLLRPWKGSERSLRATYDKLIAPIWFLVMRRISDTIYYALRDVDHWRNDFLKFFGYVFSEYVGRVLKAGFGDNRTWNIDEVVQGTQLEKDKHPDWAVLDGEVLVLVECKASIFPSMTLFRSSPERYEKAVAQKIGKAITQVSRFRKKLRVKLRRCRKLSVRSKRLLESLSHMNAFRW